MLVFFHQFLNSSQLSLCDSAHLKDLKQEWLVHLRINCGTVNVNIWGGGESSTAVKLLDEITFLKRHQN